MADIYIDDPNLAAGRVVQHGLLTPSVDGETRATMWRQVCWQLARVWRPLPRGSAGPAGGVLTDESEPQDIGAGVVEWTRMFCTVPAPRSEAVGYVYAWQFVFDGEIYELPIPTTARMAIEYFHTASPAGIPLLRGTRYVKVGISVLYLGSQKWTNGEPPAEIIAADSQISRWRGDIWQRVTPYVSGRLLTTL